MYKNVGVTTVHDLRMNKVNSNAEFGCTLRNMKEKTIANLR